MRKLRKYPHFKGATQVAIFYNCTAIKSHTAPIDIKKYLRSTEHRASSVMVHKTGGDNALSK